MKKSAIILSLGVFTVLGLVVGCGSQKTPDGFPALYPTVITITVDGKPTEGVEVSLTATPPCQWAIGGVTDASGKAEIRTHGNYLGAPEGEMKVCAKKERSVEGPTASTPKPDNDLGALREWDRQCDAERETFLVIGADYNTADTTPLTMTIKKGKNAETFDIPEDGTQIKAAE